MPDSHTTLPPSPPDTLLVCKFFHFIKRNLFPSQFWHVPFISSYGQHILNFHKKVLLRKCKRHTARCVASTPSAALSWGGTPSLAGVPPCPDLARGYPIPGQGTPPPSGPGWGPPPPPLSGPGLGTPLGKDLGPVEVLWNGDGVPPWVWTDRHLWKQYLPFVLRTRAVIIQNSSESLLEQTEIWCCVVERSQFWHIWHNDYILCKPILTNDSSLK